MTTVNATTRKDLDVPHVKGDPTKPAPDIGLRGLALLDEIIRMAEAHPENYDMRYWAMILNPPANWETDGVPETCGTAMCVAGWAAHLTGARIIYDMGMGPDGTHYLEAHTAEVPSDVVIPREWEHRIYHVGFRPPPRMTISNYAAMVLGLTSGYAMDLFDPSNSLETVKELRDEYAERGAIA